MVSAVCPRRRHWACQTHVLGCLLCVRYIRLRRIGRVRRTGHGWTHWTYWTYSRPKAVVTYPRPKAVQSRAARAMSVMGVWWGLWPRASRAFSCAGSVVVWARACRVAGRRDSRVNRVRSVVSRVVSGEWRRRHGPNSLEKNNIFFGMTHRYAT